MSRTYRLRKEKWVAEDIRKWGNRTYLIAGFLIENKLHPKFKNNMPDGVDYFHIGKAIKPATNESRRSKERKLLYHAMKYGEIENDVIDKEFAFLQWVYD